jgi:hypothetical protein
MFYFVYYRLINFSYRSLGTMRSNRNSRRYASFLIKYFFIFLRYSNKILYNNDFFIIKDLQLISRSLVCEQFSNVTLFLIGLPAPLLGLIIFAFYMLFDNTCAAVLGVACVIAFIWNTIKFIKNKFAPYIIIHYESTNILLIKHAMRFEDFLLSKIRLLRLLAFFPCALFSFSMIFFMLIVHASYSIIISTFLLSIGTFLVATRIHTYGDVVGVKFPFEMDKVAHIKTRERFLYNKFFVALPQYLAITPILLASLSCLLCSCCDAQMLFITAYAIVSLITLYCISAGILKYGISRFYRTIL